MIRRLKIGTLAFLKNKKKSGSTPDNSADYYYTGYCDLEGEDHLLMFTQSEIITAKRRARNNP